MQSQFAIVTLRGSIVRLSCKLVICTYSILPNRRVYTFIFGKVCLLASIKIKRRTLPEINVHTCLFGCIEHIYYIYIYLFILTSVNVTLIVKLGGKNVYSVVCASPCSRSGVMLKRSKID